MEKLIGKKIIKVELGDSNRYMVFTTADGHQEAFYTHGDCCSGSWFAHLTGLKNLLGEEIVSVVEREEFSEEEQKKAEQEYKKENDDTPEYLALYGYTIKTKKGVCDIEFRNESNGYYGGWCESTTVEQFDDLKEIAEDF